MHVWFTQFELVLTQSSYIHALTCVCLQLSCLNAHDYIIRSKLEREYEELREGIFQRHSGPGGIVLPVEKMTVELFLWAFVMLLSRAARLSSKLGGEELALVPYADLMNHNPYSNTYIDAQRSGMPLISRTEEVAVYADRGYKKFEQVFINYGEKGNADLLLLYGFALERNPFDAGELNFILSYKYM